MLFVSHPVADIIDECLTIKIIIINSISEYSKMTPKCGLEIMLKYGADRILMNK